MLKDVLLIKTEDEVKEYYNKNLICNNEDQKECLKKISTKELKHLHGVLYSTPVRSSIRKIDILRLIKMYFDGIDRALSMKP